MKALNEDQYAEMMLDLSEVIQKIENLNESFDKESLVKEFKLAIADNSLINTLRDEDLELAANLRMLKRVGESFNECANSKIIKSLIIGFSGVIIGSIITSVFWYFS